MKEKRYAEFVSGGFAGLGNRHPQTALFELTYRCNLDCIHCYCKGSENLEKELTADETKDILDQIYNEGCLEITFTGGEPLIREDFSEIYLYAKRKGFIINIFTNGLLLTKERREFFQKYSPRLIEITLNGITKETYEAITRVKGSFNVVMSNINELARRNMPLVIKANCLKQNKAEIAKIKAFTKGTFGEDKKRFKFDPYIFPRLNGDKTPCRYRLNPFELREVIESDSEIYKEDEKKLKSEHSLLRDKKFLYQCNAWLTGFFINPYGRLKLCQFTGNFSTDLRKKSFRQGFYDVFPNLLKEKFKSDSKCKNCELRLFCYHCPGRAYLETGDEELPVSYFCKLAEAHILKREKLKKTKGPKE